MPAIILQTSVKCTNEQKDLLAKGLSKICADGIGKPESYVMSIVQDDVTTVFAGDLQPAAMLEVKSIGGLNANVNANLSKAICEFLSTSINIKSNNIYIHFTDVAGQNWGVHTGTVA